MPANAHALIEAKGWGRGPVLIDQPQPEPSIRSFAGTYAQRKAQLLEATRPERHRRAHQLLELTLAVADYSSVEGRRRIVRAHRHFIESTSR